MKSLPFLRGALVAIAFFGSFSSSEAAVTAYWRLEESEVSNEGYSNEIPGGGKLAGAEHRTIAIPASEVPTNLPQGLVNKGSAEFSPNKSSCLLASHVSTGDFKAAFTIECWIYLRSYSENEQIQRMLWHKRDDATPMNSTPIGYQMSVNSNHYLLFFATAGAAGAKALASKSEIPLNEWTHVAVTRDSDGNFALYVNGKKEDSSKGPLAESLANKGALIFGAHRSMRSKLPNWDGFIDEIRISDQALAPADLLIGSPAQ